jgi:hypothetical protein
VDTQETNGKTIIRVLVPRGVDPPYAVDDNKIYVRDEADTGLAVRDEIVQLVIRGQGRHKGVPKIVAPEQPEPSGDELTIAPPKTGVEVVEDVERDGVRYYTMRDLRNGNVVKNVTESSARRLWHYAISQYKNLPSNLSTAAQVSWKGDLGVLRVRNSGKKVRYDFVQRTSSENRLYFGVTDDGIHGAWKTLVDEEGNGA